MEEQSPKNFTVFSIGYGNTPLKDFIETLLKFNIKYLFDVRGKPFSKWNADYCKDYLKFKLEETGITYIWLEPLSGFNKNKGFEYYRALDRIIDLSSKFPVCIMCAEQDPEKCHRYTKLTPDIERKIEKVQHILKGELIVFPETPDEKVRG